jgi:hypothetical protein
MGNFDQKQAQGIATGERSNLAPFIAGGFVLLLVFGLVALAIFWLPEQRLGSVLPTIAPKAAAEEALLAMTAEAGPKPTLPPASITLMSPIDGMVVDLGQPVDLVVSASDPIGVRFISLTSNGQGIGTAAGVEQTILDVNQSWTPGYPGTHEIVATATNRAGELVATEPINIQVIDRELLARNAPFWSQVEGNVIAMRGLAPRAAIEPTLMSRTELRQRLYARLFYTQEEAKLDALVMSAFDFVPRNFDLFQLSRRYLGDSIAGFYDPSTKDFVVVSDDKEISALEQWIYAHEFIHALQDQHFQLGLITDTSLNEEANLTIRALAEGEAQLVQEQYIEQGYFTQEDLVEIFNLINRIQSNDVGYLPPVLVNGFIFPYVTGQQFAQTLYQRGGWPALNNAWVNLPQSTEQIIHPDRYFAGDVPQIVSLQPLTNTLGSGWTLLEEAVFGEFMLREYLSQGLDKNQVDQAATGWGGDRYAVYWHEENDNLVMVLRSVWDSGAESGEFTAAFGQYAALNYGHEGQPQPDGGNCWQTADATCLYQLGAETLIVRAPSMEMATTVAGVHR